MTELETPRDMITHALERRGMRRAELARATGLAGQPNFVTMILNGNSKLPLKRVPAFAAALGLDPLELLRAVYAERDQDEWAALCEVFGVETHPTCVQRASGSRRPPNLGH